MEGKEMQGKVDFANCKIILGREARMEIKALGNIKSKFIILKNAYFKSPLLPVQVISYSSS